MIHDLESREEVILMSAKNALQQNLMPCASRLCLKNEKPLNKVKATDAKSAIDGVKNIVKKSQNDKSVIIFVEMRVKVRYFFLFLRLLTV